MVSTSGLTYHLLTYRVPTVCSPRTYYGDVLTMAGGAGDAAAEAPHIPHGCVRIYVPFQWARRPAKQDARDNVSGHGGPRRGGAPCYLVITPVTRAPCYLVITLVAMTGQGRLPCTLPCCPPYHDAPPYPAPGATGACVT